MELSRGGEPLTISQLKESVRFHSPDVIFLSETKNKRMVLDKVRRRLRYDEMKSVEHIVIAGGLAMFWKKEVEAVRLLQIDFSIENFVLKTMTCR